MIHGLPIQIVQLECRPILEEARRESQPVDHQLAVYAGGIRRADAQETESRASIILLYSEHQIM
jgi:hypothetical protein